MSNQTDILDNVLGITDVVETTTREVTPPNQFLFRQQLELMKI